MQLSFCVAVSVMMTAPTRAKRSICWKPMDRTAQKTKTKSPKRKPIAQVQGRAMEERHAVMMMIAAHQSTVMAEPAGVCPRASTREHSVQTTISAHHVIVRHVEQWQVAYATMITNVIVPSP